MSIWADPDKKRDRRVIGGGLAVMLIIAMPLWNAFSERGETGWNVFLAVLLIGMVIGALFAQRSFRLRAGEIGEARFDTRNKSDLNG